MVIRSKTPETRKQNWRFIEIILQSSCVRSFFILKSRALRVQSRTWTRTRQKTVFVYPDPDPDPKNVFVLDPDPDPDPKNVFVLDPDPDPDPKIFLPTLAFALCVTSFRDHIGCFYWLLSQTNNCFKKQVWWLFVNNSRTKKDKKNSGFFTSM
jgi:hypothetical protein